MDDIDAAYQNGSIDKSTYQLYYNENASALIKQAKTIDDVQAISDSLAKYVEEGKMTASEQIKKENELYRSIGHTIDSGHYTTKFGTGTMHGTITLNGTKYDVKVNVAAGSKIQNTLNKISANAEDGDLVGFDGNVYVMKNGKWRVLGNNEAFVEKYFNYNDKASSPNKISTPKGEGKAENR